MCKSGKPGKTTAEIDTASMDSYDVGSTEIKSYLQCIVFVVYVASRTKFKKSARHRGRPVGISPFGAESVAPVPEDRRHSLNGTVSATAAGTDLELSGMAGPRSKRVSCPCGPRSITAHCMFSQTRTAAAAGVCYAGGEGIMRRRSEKDAVLPLRGEMFAWSGSEEGKGKGGCTAWAELLIREAGRRMPINPTFANERSPHT